MTLYEDSGSHVALKLEDLRHHHFQEEEDFILFPLGLLPSLANGQIHERSEEVRLLCENVKAQMNHMSAEHQLINAFIKELKLAASDENQAEIIEFEKEVHKYAITEEEVFFPSSILIGEYLKLKTAVEP